MENILKELEERGLIKDYSNREAVEKLLNTKQTIYCGFDPTNKSLHIGNFLMIITLMRFQRYGHRIIGLVGGATGMIGDPSGKSKERAFLTADDVKFNVECIKKQLSKYLDFSDSEKGILFNNYDWIKELTLIDYLRDYGKLFNINYMLNKDVVASRLETGISYTEFSYMLLQSMDFLKLHRDYGCNLQIGGSDQWGNLTAGLELIRKAEGEENSKAECMVLHLITRSDGKKFGKSEDGALFLDEALTSPYKLYQFFLNSTDEDAIHYTKVFTFIPMEEIYELEKEHLANLGQRVAQKRLAYEVTAIVHGKEKADEAVAMSKVLFTGEYSSLKENQIIELFNNKMIAVEDNLKLEDLLINTQLCKSKREARELITGNSITINGIKFNSLDKIVTKEDCLYNKYLVIKKGKKTYTLAVIQ
jgi:tyrosyl-tRNA synthetase